MTRHEFTAKAQELNYDLEYINRMLPMLFETDPKKEFYTTQDLEMFERVLHLYSLPDEEFSVLVEPCKN